MKIQQKPYLFDGAFGTYYAAQYGNSEPCEFANLKHPSRVVKIHQDYIEAGCDCIKTNTFSANEALLECDKKTIHEILRKGYQLACESVKDTKVEVFADIGPLMEQRLLTCFDQYKEIVDIFLEEGASNFLFETLSNDQGIADITAYIKTRKKNAFVLLSFAVTADGYTRQGIPLTKLIQQSQVNDNIDGFGLNCICGPMHMARLLHHFNTKEIPVIISPNAGYPTILANHTYFRDSSDYFAVEMKKIAQQGVMFLGGCCGTTPVYTKKLRQALQTMEQVDSIEAKAEAPIQKKVDKNILREKLKQKQKIIAVEFDPPANCDIERFMNNAEFLLEQGIDALTIADCPIARARVDSSILASKLHREMGITVIPHMTCRDRNINATKALLYGLQIEDIHNVLVVTGDPIPAEDRQEVKGVFSFNSQILAGYIHDLNETLFPQPFMIYGALNINAVNFAQELEKAKRKITQGVEGFLTQPVLSQRALRNLKQAKEQLPAYLLGGILPVVSHRNAIYMNNEISGIDVDEAIVTQYEGTTREEASKLAVSISCKIADEMQPYIDGYYLITPFNRVEIIQEVVAHIQQMDNSFK